jgi:hypothetical protein
MKTELASLVLAIIIGVATLSSFAACGGERPPADAKPLSDVVKALEDQGYSTVTEVNIDNGVWEVEAYKDGQERELRVDPVTAKIISDRPDN